MSDARDLAEAHATLAVLRDAYDYDWAGAEHEYKRAVELNPNYANAHDWYSFYLAEMGRNDEAIAEARKTEQVDPVSPRAYTVACWQFYFARQYESAISEVGKALEIDKDYMPAHWCSGMASEAKGNFNQAFAELRKAVSLSGGNTETQAWLGYTYAAAGRKDDAQEVLNHLIQLRKQRYVQPYNLAEVYTGLGKKDEAFDWWGKAFAERSSFMVYLRAWPANDSLRSDPRYADLLRRMGLSP